ncbi:MAG TPA: alpha/beta hydrolase [Jiangellaceae bacterium]|nr:alpha/beta hydrolase [Jiangellaceae bacterium]
MSISNSLGQHRQIMLASGPIGYRERGSGAPIVFVHGLLTNGDLWRRVVPPLADGWRCITPDWPLGSHELPMNDDADLSTPGLARIVADFLEEMELEDVTLVGNDTGGAICQLVAAHHSERLGRLVLASCDAYEVYPPAPFGVLSLAARVPGALFLGAQLLRIHALRRSPFTYGSVMRTHPAPAISDSYVRPGLRAAIRRDTRKVLLGLSRAHTVEAARWFHRIDMPVLIAWAEQDRLFPAELADRLAADFPYARRAVVERSRTFIGEDEPDRLAALIGQFLAPAEHTDADVSGAAQ